MTKLERLTKQSVTAYAKKLGRNVVGVSHIYPRAYVLARPASGCLVVACPPSDAEPQIKNGPWRGDGSKTVRTFDDRLMAGDWCSVAYVMSACGIGEPIAVYPVESK